jgi:hypothetical protein
MYGNYIDEPIMIVSGGIYFYVQDHLYSTAALVDTGGDRRTMLCALSTTLPLKKKILDCPR